MLTPVEGLWVRSGAPLLVSLNLRSQLELGNGPQRVMETEVQLPRPHLLMPRCKQPAPGILTHTSVLGVEGEADFKGHP